MGMAASQARLLAITARIHDVEYQAQSLQNAKLQLSTQSDQVYNEYLEALDASTLTIKTFNNDGTSSLVTANFNTMCSKNKVRTADGRDYAILNKNGLLVVEDDVFDAYEKFKAKNITDAYSFAMYMITGEENSKLGGLDKLEANLKAKEEYTYTRRNDNDEIEALHKELEELCKDSASIYSGPKSDEYANAYNAKMETYRKEMYRLYSEDIFDNIYGNATTAPKFNEDYLNHYMSVFNQIIACGGCVPIRDYNGFEGDASNNAEWLEAMIESGRFTIQTVTKDDDGDIVMNTTTPSSDISLAFTETTTIDKTALAKAEAKYEHDLALINKKDKQYDLTLSKLETERSALTTEYDSVKKVIEDNIERTFGIFS